MHPWSTAASSRPPGTVRSDPRPGRSDVERSSSEIDAAAIGLLRLIGRGTDAESSYLLLPRPAEVEPSDSGGDRWHCVVWHANGRSDHSGEIEVHDLSPSDGVFAGVEALHRRIWSNAADADTCYQIPIHIANGTSRAYYGLRFSSETQLPPVASLGFVRETVASYVQSILDVSSAPSKEARILREGDRPPSGRLAPFLDDLEEGLFHIRLRTPIDVTAPKSRQCRLIRDEGYLEDCNRVFAGYFNARDVKLLFGRDLKSLLNGSNQKVVETFVKEDYKLRALEYDLPGPDGARLFGLSARGAVSDGYLTDIWGSCMEITGDVIVDQCTVEAQEEQLGRIGRDLHDTVGPLLTALRLWSGRLADTSEHQSEETAARAKKIAGLAEEATDRLREVYTNLVPRFLEVCTLGDALEDLASKVNGLGDLSVSVVRDPDADVRSNVAKMHLHRIVQEAINNALKHAEARRITIGLRRRKGRIQVEIHDDGRGFELRDRSYRSLGIENMKSRAHAIGASFSINSTPNRGTTVRVTLPREQSANSDLYGGPDDSRRSPQRRNPSSLSPSTLS